MDEVKRNDLIFFRNEILEDIKNTESKINDKIGVLSKQFENFSLINEQKNEYYKKKFDEVVINVDTRDFQSKIKDKMEKYGQKINEAIINNNVKIQKIEKDLSNACFKYDKIYLKNMSSSGLIGDGCPYPTMKAFFIFLDKKIKELITTKDKAFSEFKSLKEYIEQILENYEKQMEKNMENIDNNVIEKLNGHDKLTKERVKVIEDRFESIRLENSKYMHNIIKNQEIINEKLKLEVKRYTLINDSLIKFYNTQSKLLNNSKESRYRFSPIKKKKESRKTLTINEILPALKKIEENYNLNLNLYKNTNDESDKEIKNSNNAEIKPQRKESFNHSTSTIKKPNKSLFLRKKTYYGSDLKELLNPNGNMLNRDSNFSSKNIKQNFSKIFNNNRMNEKKIDNENELNDSIKGLNALKTITIGKEEPQKKLSLDISNNNYLSYENKMRNSKKKEEKKQSKIKLIISPSSINPINKIENKENNNQFINKKNEIKGISFSNKTIEAYTQKSSKKEIFNTKSYSTEKESIEKNREESKEENNKKYKEEIDKNINNAMKDVNKNIDVKIDEKINNINKTILKYNKQANDRIDFLIKQISILFFEINKVTKEKKNIKNILTKNLIIKSNNNSIPQHTTNFNNIYISGDEILPFKTSEQTFRNNYKSNSVKKNLKMNSRVLNTTQNNEDNFNILLNKIEPYLIKKFKNQNG